ncbi:hypothetical protein Csa_015524 [Cucumis sativus]|uniref:Gibberellin 9,11-dehydrogenase n=2 Tax=Cucumis sativus TaxID=3659 RepID=A0A6H2MW86_CUCSA|nr:hypothetical protein Csa_015524 [Cucumis sativus]SLM22339.1 Gibberellin 9,11-dehydrogenase [Cucumis sativus]
MSDVFKTHDPLNIPTNKSLDSDSDSIPVIDLSLPNAPALMNNAFKTCGAFQVLNHGVPLSLLKSMESFINDLFDLPTSQKLKVVRSPESISGFGLVPLSKIYPKRPWGEGFTIIGNPVDHLQKLWPQDCKKYCDLVEEYNKEMKSLCGKLLWLTLGELGITPEDIYWAGPDGDFKTNNQAIRMNSYPVCPEPDDLIGLPPHSDTSALTILYQTTKGLQVSMEGKGWVDVEPINGALVVQVGDMLHILTNGMYPPSVHQAVVNQTSDRISTAYFFGPPPKGEVSPLKKLVTPTQPLRYPTVTWADYLRKKYVLYEKALPSIRLSAPAPTGLSNGNDQNLVKVG